MRTSTPRPLVVLIVLGIVLAGLGGLWFASVGESSFGWFAYAPMSGTTYSPDVVVLSTQHQLALGTCAFGALLLSGATGYAVGRRRGGADRSEDRVGG